MKKNIPKPAAKVLSGEEKTLLSEAPAEPYNIE